MIGIPVLQVYGLTETTAICTMDDVRQVTAGRVGPAIRGIQMRLSGQGEILVMGPNIFPGYWNRPPADSEVFQEGWFRTGDQGEVDTRGNWKIVGRMKNIIITTGGHNISPEPIEQRLLEALPASTQVMVVGNGRKYLAALLTEPVSREAAARVIEACNRQLPHYRQIRRFHIAPSLSASKTACLPPTESSGERPSRRISGTRSTRYTCLKQKKKELSTKGH